MFRLSYLFAILVVHVALISSSIASPIAAQKTVIDQTPEIPATNYNLLKACGKVLVLSSGHTFKFSLKKYNLTGVRCTFGVQASKGSELIAEEHRVPFGSCDDEQLLIVENGDTKNGTVYCGNENLIKPLRNREGVALVQYASNKTWNDDPIHKNRVLVLAFKAVKKAKLQKVTAPKIVHPIKLNEEKKAKSSLFYCSANPESLISHAQRLRNYSNEKDQTSSESDDQSLSEEIKLTTNEETDSLVVLKCTNATNFNFSKCTKLSEPYKHFEKALGRQSDLSTIKLQRQNLVAVVQEIAKSGVEVYKKSLKPDSPTELLKRISCSKVCGQNRRKERSSSQVQPEFHPWSGQLKLVYHNRYDNHTSVRLCGSALISHNYAITAAHCLYNNSKKVDLVHEEILLHTETASPNVSRVNTVDVEKYIIHPLFRQINSSNTWQYDVALLKLSPNNFTEQFVPACLPKHNQKFVGEAVAVNIGGTDNDELQSKIKIRQPHFCEKVPTFDEDTQECGTAANPDGCFTTAGAPLLKLRSGKWTLVGITSSESRCDSPDQPLLYTKVAAFTDFFNRHAKDSRCFKRSRIR